MLIKLHSQATTTPKIRAAIQASDEPAWIVAERHGVTSRPSTSGASAAALKTAVTRRIGCRRR